MAEDMAKNRELEELEEREAENEQKNQNTKNNKAVEKKKGFTIFNYSIWRLLAYFIIYSIVGYIVETLFGIVRYGIWESKQSFLYGPFCSIYGLGAVFIIMSLQYFKKNYNTIFIGGAVLGLVLEYIISWIGEVIFKVRWWDYSNMPFNLNGRVCLLYGIFWGFLSLYLMISLNPKIDKMIDWVKKKLGDSISRGIILFLILFMLIDCILSCLAIMAFMDRTIVNNDIEVKNKSVIESLYEKMYSDEERTQFINKYWGDVKMIRTFPQLKVEDINGNIIYFKELLPDIKPYYMELK